MERKESKGEGKQKERKALRELVEVKGEQSLVSKVGEREKMN